MSDFEPLEAILFDLDGTLLDSQDFWMASFLDVMRSDLELNLSTEEVLPYFGMSTENLIRHYAPADRVREILAHLLDTLSNHYDCLKLFPGVRSALEFLWAAGFKLAVVTAQAGKLNRDIRPLLGIDDLVGCWITADESPAQKPDPAPLLLAMDRLAARPATTMMVGDTFFDMQAGRTAGLRVGAVLWGMSTADRLLAYQPDYIFHHAGELHTLACLRRPFEKSAGNSKEKAISSGFTI